MTPATTPDRTNLRAKSPEPLERSRRTRPFATGAMRAIAAPNSSSAPGNPAQAKPALQPLSYAAATSGERKIWVPLQYFSTSFGNEEEEDEEEEEEEEEEAALSTETATPEEGVRSRKSASASKVLPQLGQVGLGAESRELRPPAWETEKRVVWQIGQARSKEVVVVVEGEEEEEEEAVGVDDDEAADDATAVRINASRFASSSARLEAVSPLRVARGREKEHAGAPLGVIVRKEAAGGARASMVSSRDVDCDSRERVRWCGQVSFFKGHFFFLFYFLSSFEHE